MDVMCVQSLPPNLYEQWTEIMNTLRSNRKELRQGVDNFHAATAMVGVEYLFALNMQMTPLRCVVTGVDCSRGNPLFVIDLKVDPGTGEFEPGETHLSGVSPKFLFTLDAERKEA